QVITPDLATARRDQVSQTPRPKREQSCIVAHWPSGNSRLVGSERHIAPTPGFECCWLRADKQGRIGGQFFANALNTSKLRRPTAVKQLAELVTRQAPRPQTSPSELAGHLVAARTKSPSGSGRNAERFDGFGRFCSAIEQMQQSAAECW